MRWVTSLITSCFSVQLCLGAVINVPSDQPTIQAGIDASASGDTVMVSDGHYHERIDFLGKAIHVASEFILDEDTLHIANTVIDADTLVLGISDTGSVVAFVNFEDSTSILSGFTIQKGTGTLIPGYGRLGGGIFCNFSGPRIEDCVITHNSDAGCGFFGSNVDNEAVIAGCRLSDNCGEAIRCEDYFHFTVDNCEIQSDTVFCGYASYPNIRNSTLVNCGIDGYGYILTMAGCRLEQCSLYGNLALMYMSDDTLVESSLTLFDHPDGGINLLRCILLDSQVNGIGADIYVDSSLVVGSILVTGNSPTVVIRNSTIIGQGLDLPLGSSRVTIEASVIVADDGEAISCGETAKLTLICSDIFCLGDCDWLDGNPGVLDTSNVFFLDPEFCDPDSGDYHINAYSPCTAEYSPCGELVGAFGVGCESSYVCGDADRSGAADIDDVMHLIAYIFSNGLSPIPVESGDADCSGDVDIDDVVYLIAYIFSGGNAPCDPDGDEVPDC